MLYTLAGWLLCGLGRRAAEAQMENATIDIDRMIRREEVLSGCWPLGGFERLAEMLAEPAGDVRWRARAWREDKVGRPSEVFLALELRATVPVPCVRCLGPVPLEVDDARRFLLVKDEQTAARLDDPAAELEVVAADDPFHLAELVEDELILAIPALPRHERCGLPGETGGAESAETSSDVIELRRPLAGLAQLRGGKDEPES